MVFCRIDEISEEFIARSFVFESPFWFGFSVFHFHISSCFVAKTFLFFFFYFSEAVIVQGESSIFTPLMYTSM